MRIQYKTLFLVSVIFIFALAALAADLTGKWKAEFETQVGLQKYTFEFKVDGEKLTGKAYFERMNQKGEAELLEGKIKGDEIFFVEKISVQGNELRVEYKGKVTGDEINFTRKTGDIATVQFVAKRVKN
ncbi:MAG: hypothetical protein MOB07_22630 [Acidobacteria bacterium]|nr:hypothetical protein [Acidobacteriota bacterium]